MQYKKTLFLYMLTNLFFSTFSFAEDFLCSLYNAFEVADKVLSLEYDKAKHCSVSCMLARRCGVVDALELGALKEFTDIFGPGEADLRDISANLQGAKFALYRTTKSDDDCIELCSTTYIRLE